jgi:hypothetical protein
MSTAAFFKTTLGLKSNLFTELLSEIDFEPVAKGRIGNHLVNAGDKGIPIVRTTTKYNIPAHNFTANHHQIIDCINDAIRENNLNEIPGLYFNNALIEVYDATYYKMNFHSDQSLDLDTDSYIGVFSCYENPDALLEQHIRKLQIKDKVSDEEFEYSLTHNSVMLFSVATNTKFLHKIVLDGPPNAKQDNKWLGITFRTSQTHIHFDNNIPRFANGNLLELANKEQEAEFYKLRGQENRSLDFVYPDLTYTINFADTLMPKNNQ